VVSTTPWPLYPRERPVLTVQEAGWAPGPLWTCTKNLARNTLLQDESNKLYLNLQLNCSQRPCSHNGAYDVKKVFGFLKIEIPHANNETNKELSHLSAVPVNVCLSPTRSAYSETCVPHTRKVATRVNKPHCREAGRRR
jgi:hypothetical protein